MNKENILLEKINAKEKEYAKNKLKRSLLTIICIAICFIILYLKNKSIGNTKEFLYVIIGSILGAIIYFYINIIIFLPLFNASIKENKNLENLKKEYEELKK